MAIVPDNSSFVENQTGSTYSIAFTVSGANTILKVGVAIADSANNKTVSTITFGGDSLTQTAVVNNTVANREIETWQIINPKTGSQTLAFTLSGAPDAFWNACWESFSGARQTSQPDASGSTNNTSGVTTTTKSITTLTDNCWLWGIATNGSATNPAVSAGTTFRASVYNRAGNGYELFMIDSNGAKTIGSNSLGFTHTSATSAIIVESIAPSNSFVPNVQLI